MPHSLTIVIMRPMTARAARMTVYQYWVMNRRKVVRDLEEKRRRYSVTSGPRGSTYNIKWLGFVIVLVFILLPLLLGTMDLKIG